MTDERFTELVNLYFDKEISADQLEELKSELAARPDRKRAFTERCRLDKAMRLALKPQRSRSGRSRSGSRSRRRSSSGISRSRTRSRGAGRLTPLEESLRRPAVTHFPRWILASGIAASLAIGLLLLPPVFRDTTDARSQPALVGVSEKDLVDGDPLENLGKSELRRYAEIQRRREAQRHASLVAQMRLMGLRPELTPEDKDLREVSLAAAHEPKQSVSQAELFRRIQGLKALPDPELLRVERAEDTPGYPWTDTYESSLTEFEKL